MKILLIVPRYNLTNEPDYEYFFPLGLAYIFSVIKQAGHDIDCLNMNHFRGKSEDIINKSLDLKRYDFICTGGNALLYAIIEIILKTAKKHSSMPKTILGGPIITTEPDLIFHTLNPDYAIVGEGEETILELFEHLEKNKNLNNIKGIIYRDKDKKIIKTIKRNPPKNLDAIPYPDLDSFGFKEKLNHSYTNTDFMHNSLDFPRIYSILCSRSCPFKCTFCYHDSLYRQRSIKNIMAELDYAVKKYKINIILPYDECLGLNRKRLIDFCNGLKKIQKEISWDLKWICQVRVDAVDKETLEILKDSGCEAMCYGFESFSPVVLKSMGKNIMPEQIEKAFFETIRSNLAQQTNFIFGDVAETKETARETLNWWKKNARGQVGLGVITPYPGSELYNHCIEKGIIRDKLDFIKNKVAPGYGLWLNMTNRMTDKEFNKLRKEILDSVGKYAKFVTPLSMKQSKKNVYEIKVKCPFCKEVIGYKNCFIQNRLTYGFNIICRNCHMRFFIVSLIQKIAYANYSKVRTIRDTYLYLKRFFGKKRL